MGRFHWHKTVFLSHAILDAIFQSILARCCARNFISESRKIIKFYWKNRHFLLLGCFNIRSLLDAILVSTWIHFLHQKSSKIASWRSLGASCGLFGGILGGLGGILGSPKRYLGDYCMLSNGLGRFQNAPERETVNFQWFWEVLGG